VITSTRERSIREGIRLAACHLLCAVAASDAAPPLRPRPTTKPSALPRENCRSARHHHIIEVSGEPSADQN
jgi:hypothetical protein